jgi:hypothetical protein
MQAIATTNSGCHDTGTPVDDKDYQVPFKYTGKLNKLTLTIGRPKLTPQDEKRLMEARVTKNPATGRTHEELTPPLCPAL